MLSRSDARLTAPVGEFVERSLVLLTDTLPDVRPTYAASGVLLRTARGAAVVLTASHALPDEAPINVTMNAGQVFDAVEAVARHPNAEVDVAAALLRPAAAQRLISSAVSLAQIEESPVHRVEPKAILVVAGYPDQFTADAVVADSVVERRFTAIVKFTNNHGHDRRRLSFEWRRGYADDGATSPAHAAFNVTPDEPVHLRKPSGLSGGPVYRIAPAPFETFEPVAHCKLIAVAVEYVNQRELAAPWWTWRDWLATLLATC